LSFYGGYLLKRKLYYGNDEGEEGSFSSGTFSSQNFHLSIILAFVGLDIPWVLVFSLVNSQYDVS